MSLLSAWIIALILVAVVSAATLGYGLLASILSKQSRTSLVLGLGLYTCTILITGLCGGYNFQVQTLLVGIGLVALGAYRHRLPDLLSGRCEGALMPRGRDWLWLILPMVYGLTRFFSCGLPQQHSDPLYYHLSAPQHWAELGRIQLTPDHPSEAFTGLWETLYGLPQIWLGTKGANVHVIVQIFAQWMHFFWGQVGCVFLAAALLRRLAPSLEHRLGLSIFLGWLATTQPALEWLGCLAKNEYIVALFALAAVLEAMERKWFLVGVLMAFSYSTKVLAASTAIAILAFIPWRKWALYLCGAALGAFPVLLRNVTWTRNPVFPTLDNVIGPHWVSSWWIQHNLSYGGGIRFDAAMLPWLSRHFLEGGLPKVLVATGLAALAVELVRRQPVARTQRGRWAAFIVIQIIFALLMLRPAADGRYASLAAFSLVIFAVGCFAREAARCPRFWSTGIWAIAPLGLLINSPVDQLVKIPRDYWREPSTHYVEQFHPVYDMQKWVQANVAPSDKIVFLGEKQQFYLDRPFEAIIEMKKWEDILTPVKTSTELFAVLRQLGFRYVHFLALPGGFPPIIRPYWPEIQALSDKAVFRSSSSLIFDLKAP